MWNAKNAMLKNIIAIKYEQLTSYKKLYHIKGTLNKYEGLYITGVIDQLTNEIETLQDLLKSYNGLDRRTLSTKIALGDAQ